MTRTLLVRGLLAGVVAGLAAFVIAYFLGEPAVAGAVALERAHADAHGGEPALVGRSIQSTLGLLTATVTFAAAIGGLFSIAYATAVGRTGQVGARTLAGYLAAGGFLTVNLIPFLKYPSNPPSVGDPATLRTRTALFFCMIAMSLLFAAAGVWTARRLTRLGGWDRALAGVATYLALTVVAMMLLPPAAAVGSTFPAELLWQFRTATVATQLTTWAMIGLVFGVLSERRPVSARRSATLRPQPHR